MPWLLVFEAVLLVMPFVHVHNDGFLFYAHQLISDVELEKKPASSSAGRILAHVLCHILLFGKVALVSKQSLRTRLPHFGSFFVASITGDCQEG